MLWRLPAQIADRRLGIGNAGNAVTPFEDEPWTGPSFVSTTGLGFLSVV